ncbi:hypothetical protein B0H17DRAFT_1207809 [Mycena rosella]|uniref:Ribonuclease H1 N-terminal domain-containing protein n=1 Tax=Mycena rosella TaxID=1033263 RepID=A0AAD7D5Y2_MYCRO|nr:hypothetical protein B0H17DRAFT_1207809 [Mycena rosella]
MLSFSPSWQSLTLPRPHLLVLPLSLPPVLAQFLPPHPIPPASQTLPRISHRTTRSTVYQFESPTKRGYTTDWSLAGSATQGVPGSQVHTVQASRKRVRTSKKAAYVVFCGIRCGVFLTWPEAKSLVTGVPNAIFRGYGSVAEADATFAYAVARSWVSNSDLPLVVAVHALPLPQTTIGVDAPNPLNGAESLDDKWYVVYRGITPGVYRSHLESQLNTLGVRGSLHKAIPGREAAQAKYSAAMHRGEAGASRPPPTLYMSSPSISFCGSFLDLACVEYEFPSNYELPTFRAGARTPHQSCR